MGVSDYDISSTLGTSVSQRLVRKICKNCGKPRDFTDQEKALIEKIGKKYNVEFDLKGKQTYSPVGCKECNNTGYYERVGIFEVLPITDEIKEIIVKRRL
jgi:type II secretory ATPase GspE/PulE/Tfp pilus assembly ATPase PilB-like protein